jgi:hypothetical protein
MGAAAKNLVIVSLERVEAAWQRRSNPGCEEKAPLAAAEVVR